jgi:hypothetical protein
VGECSLKKDIDAVKKKIKVNVDSGDCSAQKLKKFRKDLRYLKAAALSESIDQHLEVYCLFGTLFVIGVCSCHLLLEYIN